MHRTARIHTERIHAARRDATCRVLEGHHPDPSSSSSSSSLLVQLDPHSSAAILKNEPVVKLQKYDADASVSLTRRRMVEDRLHWFVDKMQAITYGLFVALYHPSTTATTMSRRRHHCPEHHGGDATAPVSSSTAVLLSSLDWKGLAAATLYEYYRNLHPTAGLVADLETTKEHLIALHQFRRQQRRKKAAAKVCGDGGSENEKKKMKNQEKIVVEPPPVAWIGGDAPAGDLAAPMPDMPPSSSSLPLASPAAVATAVKSSSFNNNNNNIDDDNERLFRTLDQDSKRVVADMVQTVGTALAVLTRALFVETMSHHRAMQGAVFSTGSTRPRAERALLVELTLDGPLPTPRPPPPSLPRSADTTSNHHHDRHDQQPNKRSVPPPHNRRRCRPSPPIAVAADVVVSSSSSSNHHNNYDDDTVENHENHPTRKRGRASNHKNKKKRKMTSTTSTSSSDQHQTSVRPPLTKKQRVL
jgi:hypothetical protein